MFLSKILADRRRWDVVHDLEDRDRLHKKMLAFFPEIPGGPTNMRERRGVLFRVEPLGILMQSSMAPENGRAPTGYSLVVTKEVAAVYETIQAGRIYGFRLDANTSVKVAIEQNAIEWIPDGAATAVETRQRTRRVGCGSDQERSKWLALAAKRSGFMPEAFSFSSLPVTKIGKEGRLESTRFEGRLKVVDRQLFLYALSKGIGPGKNYGLGLLSLKSV